MLKEINGEQFRELLDHGLKNLRLYREKVNDLNVFPVPDGDTGSNMILTLENGMSAIRSGSDELDTLARAFVTAVIFGARGNSGVILSQFLKGMCECFYDAGSIRSEQLSAAFEAGVACAYRAVAEPVEGTMLTVLRESSAAVASACKRSVISAIDEAIAVFLQAAYVSLENTPELLPVLKSAGVIDSGGAGLVYMFEGMQKYLNNEPIENKDEEQSDAHYIDYSKFNPESEFALGYCTELLIQLLKGKQSFDYASFKDGISAFGSSIVTSYEDEKVKVHIHTSEPEKLLAFCHRFGEFLAVKIENMSVQHSEASRLYLSPQRSASAFGVVAVSHDGVMRERYLAMGADVVIDASSGYNPSAKDFTEAFADTGCSVIFVFPNSKNAIFAAEQASGLYKDARVIVLPSKSAAECYSALSMLDFDSCDIEGVTNQLMENIVSIFTVTVTRAVKDAVYDSRSIRRNDYIALAGSRLLGIDSDPFAVAEAVCAAVFEKNEYSVVTVFLGASLDAEAGEKVADIIAARSEYTDVDTINTRAEAYDMLLSFE